MSKGLLLRKWVEVHALNHNNETAKVVSADLKPINGSYLDAFAAKIAKIAPIYHAVSMISFRLYTSGTYFSVREILYR